MWACLEHSRNIPISCFFLGQAGCCQLHEHVLDAINNMQTFGFEGFAYKRSPGYLEAAQAYRWFSGM